MTLLENRKVRFDYEILESFEAGISLLGWEVKSIRVKSANFASAWVKIRNEEAFLMNFKISRWKFSQGEQDPFREKKLLLHKKEIVRIEAKMATKNLTLVPYKIYLKHGKLKCEICLVKGRKKHEKRQVLKDRAAVKEAQKAIKTLSRE